MKVSVMCYSGTWHVSVQWPLNSFNINLKFVLNHFFGVYSWESDYLRYVCMSWGNFAANAMFLGCRITVLCLCEDDDYDEGNCVYVVWFKLADQCCCVMWSQSRESPLNLMEMMDEDLHHMSMSSHGCWNTHTHSRTLAVWLFFHGQRAPANIHHSLWLIYVILQMYIIHVFLL